MSVNLYQTGVSGLLAAQQQLATTGHNIANVNTEGYNRQRAEQNAAIGIYTGNGNFIGSGTYVQDVTRIYNQFSYKEQLHSKTNLGYSDTIHNSLNQLNEITSFSGGAIGNSIEKFYQAMNSIADNPSDSGLRSIALSQAEILSSDFRSLNENIDQMEKSANGEIQLMADKITKISFELAKINDQILQNDAASLTGQPNDLLDRRDQLITELSEYTSVNTVTDANGVMTVMIGSGSTLVAGITPLSLSIEAGDPDPMQTSLQLSSANGQVEINKNTIGGALGAKFEFRDEHLSKIRNEVNRLAMAISQTLNKSQSEGLDLNQQQGLNVFTDINSAGLMQSRVSNFSDNTGTVSASVNITDVSLVPTDEFQVEWDGANYVMTNMTDNSTQTLVLTPPNTYDTGMGFSFVIDSGAPAAGDKFLVRPTENSAALMQVTLKDADGIAASTPVEVKASEDNVSSGALNIIAMNDPVAARNFVNVTNSGLTVDVYQNGANYDYRIYDAGVTPPNPPSTAGAITSGSFAPGATAVIDLPPAPATMAFQIEISGDPVGQGALAPEVFEIKDAFGIGNGNNAGLMALTQEKGILNNGKETFSQSLGISTARVGSDAKSAELVADTADALFTQAYNRNQETSGVNLDEEAANMLKFQQAYQASSRIISVANEIFDTLLAAV
ncbi:flagellar hook-associated protein FlgK [Thalassotalea insulae]|uniref:Flagellar hook-associated protein 1 n=1 Tax=Thalassotalea insulae TaxID=2056778 RepID=A0ABQ6GNT2_9GAMM|nr:flagellar hook-associated protein FlgK [Thalassotalea insulae]GLX77653.1 flagellar hook-associated protein FlgK [Thalassotalea insulae]